MAISLIIISSALIVAASGIYQCILKDGVSLWLAFLLNNNIPDNSCIFIFRVSPSRGKVNEYVLLCDWSNDVYHP